MLKKAVKFNTIGQIPCAGWPGTILIGDFSELPPNFDAFMTDEEIKNLCNQLKTTPEYLNWINLNTIEFSKRLEQEKKQILKETDWIESETIDIASNIKYRYKIAMFIYRQKIRDTMIDQNTDTVEYPEIPTENNLILNHTVNFTDPEKLDTWLNILWWSTHLYQFYRIEATAASVIILKATLTSTTKCEQIKNWIDALWVKYKNEKNKLLTNQEVNFDMSSHGELPYSVWDALNE